MQELGVLTSQAVGGVVSKPSSFSAENGKIFQNLLKETGNQQNDVLAGLVNKAEEAHQNSRVKVTQEMRKFDRSDELVKLIEASHQSAMHSVQLQLTGKVGTKLSESFEQLYKQQ